MGFIHHVLRFVLCGAFLLQGGCQTPTIKDDSNVALSQSYTRTDWGVEIYPSQASSNIVRIQVWDENILRITSSQRAPIPNYRSLMIDSQPVATPFELSRKDEQLILQTAKIEAAINLVTGGITARDQFGEVLLETQDAGVFSEVTTDPAPSSDDRFAIEQNFVKRPGEAFYGLGQQQNGLVNYAGSNVELTTHNLEIAVPFLVSSRHYGILWDNNGITRFGAPYAPQPLSEGFELHDTSGTAGGLTAYYYDGDKLLLTRTEADTNYQHLARGDWREFPLPEPARTAEDLRIELHGTITAKKAGRYTLKTYSSGYLKLYINNQLAVDRWRPSWNPWYEDTYVQLKEGESKKIKVYWTPQNGYFRLLQYGPDTYAGQEMAKLSSETAETIDYYIVAGTSMDDVIAGYRRLTGKAVMLPKWAYGFWQSRERYQTQKELVDTLKTYRDLKIPIDNIVLDWSYWPEHAWGSHEFNPLTFRDPQAMVDRVHELNAQIMISVWPKFYPTTEHFREFNERGWIFNKNLLEQNYDWIGSGYLNGFYDAFTPEATNLFWKQIDQKLNLFGFDAWWLDATEPDMHSNLSVHKRKDFLSPNGMGSGAEMFNAYALPHAEAVYRGDRISDPDQRTLILTRSGFAGIQRAAAAVWSGDTASRWDDMREQIAAGIGISMSGVPNWTFDIGGFTPEDRYRYTRDGQPVESWHQMDKAHRKEWQELNLRWFQFGAFAPLFRSHGQNPHREIFNLARYDSNMYDALVRYTRLRYHLMPYIYSLAGDTYHKDGTIMRGLAMDFPHDPAVASIADQYLFGPSLLVNPVTEFGARERPVYLPEGVLWYDFYTGEKHAGGQTIQATAPLYRMPIYVKAGSIIPTGPEIQYVDQKPNAPITLNIYSGADGSFELYEDDGQSYDYENGSWSRIPFHFDNERQLLTIGKRVGYFKDMPLKRTIHIRWIRNKGHTATDFNQPADAILEYSGDEMRIKL